MTYYDFLGIPSTADFNLIRSAYLSADARLTASGDHEGASAVRRAYAVLGDEGLRRDYDRMLLDQFRASGSSFAASAPIPVVRRRKKRSNISDGVALAMVLCFGIPLLLLIFFGNPVFFAVGSVIFVLVVSGLLINAVLMWRGKNADNPRVQVMSVIFFALLALPLLGVVIALVNFIARNAMV